MTNYATGHQAEKVAARHLEKLGYKIVQLNWRHARAEIDVVAEKRELLRLKRYLVFFEVKHRKNSAQGRGLDYITPKKLQQMQFAACLYISKEGYGGEFCLGAIELEGDDFAVTQLIERL